MSYYTIARQFQACNLSTQFGSSLITITELNPQDRFHQLDNLCQIENNDGFNMSLGTKLSLINTEMCSTILKYLHLKW